MCIHDMNEEDFTECLVHNNDIDSEEQVASYK